MGAGLVCRGTGGHGQKRGTGFWLDPKAVNPLTPGRKPCHTLNPALARFDDGRTMVYGSMGGEAQPEFQAAVFTRIARFGMDPGKAIAAPRWRAGRTWGEGASGVTIENRFDPDVVAALERAGHSVLVLGEGYSDSMGHAGAVIRTATGHVSGASDPRSDGAAAGG